MFRRVDAAGAPREESSLSKTDKHLTEEEQGEICFRFWVQIIKRIDCVDHMTHDRGRHIMMGYLMNPKLGKAHEEEMLKKNRV